MICRLVLLTLLGLAACADPASAPGALAGSSMPVLRFAPKVLAALDGAPAAASLPLSLTVPGDGAVIPWTFPTATIQWEDGFAGNTFRVRVRRESGARVVEYQTLERRLDIPESEWRRVRAAVGEGGSFEVELVAASVLPSGRLLRGPTRALSRVRFSRSGEHPTGRVLYGDRRRHAGASPGPVFAEQRNSVAMQVEMDGRATVVMSELPGVLEMRARYAREQGKHSTLAPQAPGAKGDDGAGLRADAPVTPGPGPSGATAPALDPREYQAEAQEQVASRSVDFTPVQRRPGVAAWQSLSRRYDDNCLSCHSMSGDGRFLAITGISTEGTPEGYSGTNGTTYIIRMADMEILRILPDSRNTKFHPSKPSLLVYAQMGMETALMRRTSTFHSDLRVLDLASGLDQAVPGADDPERCEMTPDWSPDGRRIVFMRSNPGEPCDGRRGHYSIATVPWTGEPATATPLLGASDNQKANLSPTWSKDGQWIVFQQADQGVFSTPSGDLMVVSADGGPARRLSISTSAMESVHAFSPDGRWLAFLSNRDMVNSPRVYIARFFDDGRTAPALPLLSAGSVAAYVDYLDWVPTAPAAR